MGLRLDGTLCLCSFGVCVCAVRLSLCMTIGAGGLRYPFSILVLFSIKVKSFL